MKIALSFFLSLMTLDAVVFRERVGAAVLRLPALRHLVRSPGPTTNARAGTPLSTGGGGRRGRGATHFLCQSRSASLPF